VVINFSSGVLAGPHDGTHPIETALDQIIERRRNVAPTEIILPAGNSHLSRTHAEVTLPPRRGNRPGGAQLTWRALPDDRTCTYIEIWLPRSHSEAGGIGVELMIAPPGGELSPPLGDGVSKRAIAWRPNGRDAVCKVYYEYFPPPTDNGRYLIAVLPTAFHEPPTQLAPCGDWTIQLRNWSDKPVAKVGAWVQWDDRPLGYPRTGRQSYFVDPNYERFHRISGRWVETDNDISTTRRAGTISGIATGSNTVVIGGFRGKERKATLYSGAGPIAAKSAWRAGPDAVAVTDDSFVHDGVLGAGTRSGSIVALNGTSVAAPRVANRLADELAKGTKGHGREIVHRLAKRDEAQYPPCPKQPIPERGGCGRIKTRRAVRLPRYWD
jgi:hypothetical protein